MLRALESIEQGIARERDRDHAWREDDITANFAQEFEALGGKDVMGIFGQAHTGLGGPGSSGQVPCMGAQLYGDTVHSRGLAA